MGIGGPNVVAPHVAGDIEAMALGEPGVVPMLNLSDGELARYRGKNQTGFNNLPFLFFQLIFRCRTSL